MFYLDAALGVGATVDLPAQYEERAVYVAEGEIEVESSRYGPGQMVVFAAGATAAVLATTPSRAMLLGGAPLDGPRYIWWNFVSSSLERIEQAKRDWQRGGFAPVPGDDERIPLPAQ
jgi:redox-sensitive bicupin YhaK (pirin superfamily)